MSIEISSNSQSMVKLDTLTTTSSDVNKENKSSLIIDDKHDIKKSSKNVDITTQAKELSEIHETIKNQPIVNADRVKEMKAKLATGLDIMSNNLEKRISAAEKLADKILSLETEISK